jgi:hypothetical protein
MFLGGAQSVEIVSYQNSAIMFLVQILFFCWWSQNECCSFIQITQYIPVPNNYLKFQKSLQLGKLIIYGISAINIDSFFTRFFGP